MEEGMGETACENDSAISSAYPNETLLPKWFTARRLLILFCFVNVFVYLDRGLIASNGVNGSPPSEKNPEGTGIQGAFKLTYFEDGLLPGAFMVGLLISSPVFAEACKTVSAFRLLAVGMGIWSLACIGCGAAPNFVVLMICRALVGVGEASFVALAVPFIDDYAPAARKSMWLGIFYMCIPVGFALGYIFGGIIAGTLGWRYAFVLEALPMIPFVIFAATAQPITFQGSAPVGKAMAPDQAGAKHGFLHPLAVLKNDVKVVMSQRVYATICPAYTAYVAVLGVYAFWGPQAGKALFFDVDDDSSDADLAFGGMTVLTGIAGSLAGGFLLDRVGSTLVNANIICATSCIVGCFFALIAFIFTQTFAQFMTFFALGQLAMFALQAPIAGMIMWTVPRSLRPMATSLMTVYIHLLGDVPSPPLLGLLQSYLSRGKSIEEAAQQWRWSMSIITTLLLLAGMLFFVAAKLVTPRSDYRRDGEASPEDPDEAPLLPAPGATSDEE